RRGAGDGRPAWVAGRVDSAGGGRRARCAPSTRRADARLPGVGMRRRAFRALPDRPRRRGRPGRTRGRDPARRSVHAAPPPAAIDGVAVYPAATATTATTAITAATTT